MFVLTGAMAGRSREKNDLFVSRYQAGGKQDGTNYDQWSFHGAC
jgi:hypothetical protein